MGKLRDSQNALAAWQERNFPTVTWWQDLMGVTEEVGELNHSLLKQVQNIRGTSSEHEAKAKDAVGDTVVYLIQLCTKRGWDFEDILDDTIEHVLTRDWVADPMKGVTG